MDKEWKEFIKQKRQEYRKIRHVECPAFGGEKVYFTDKGFNHLIRKKRRFRAHFEQVRRLNLISYAKHILSNAIIFTGHKQIGNVNLWSFEKNLMGEKIIVVVREINNEPKHFLSVMDKL